MSAGLVLLWLLVLVILLVGVLITLTGWRTYRSVRSTIQAPITACIIPIEQLPSITALECCVVGTVVTASRYVADLDVVVNPVPVPPVRACQDFCRQGVTLEGGVNRCISGEGQTNFAQCLERTRPQDCTGLAMPVAATGVTYYYTQSATNGNCTLTRPCGT